MSFVKRILLSWKTTLTLVLLILTIIIIGYIFPQRVSSTVRELETWRQAHPVLSPLVQRTGLDHVYSTVWFALLLFVTMLSLALSSFEQIKAANKKTFGLRGGDFTLQRKGDVLESTATLDELSKALKSEGYLRIAHNEQVHRFVKYPWGYWGNALLHAGMLVAIGASLTIVLTQQSGVIKLYEGEVFPHGGSWGLQDNGVLADNLELPGALRLENVTPEFWETDDVKQVTTEFSLIDSADHAEKFKLSINQILNYKGIRIYQQSFGHAFFVEFTDRASRVIPVVLLMESQSQRDKPSYGSFRFKEIPFEIKAKYFADAEKKSMDGKNPLFVMRLLDHDHVVGEAELKVGERGVIGDYTVRLLRVSRWVGLIFTVTPGMSGLYLAFFIIILGAALSYFTPPREFVVTSVDDVLLVKWRGTRFAELYRDEYERIAVAFCNKHM